MRSRKIVARSAFIDKQGRFKASGSMRAFPWNPHPYDECPAFRIGFNGLWFECRLVDCSETYGWVAQSVETLELEDDNVPKVELRR